jgi:xanthine dehydrogenase accessory factor
MIMNSLESDYQEQGRTSAYRENVLPDLAAWSGKGERCALVTLVGVDGNAPRAEGAQMAVSESGRWVGYISGGCLEQAIALEAVEAIKAAKPRLLRYGKGSPYFDIRLPCGSGLDIFIQPIAGTALIGTMQEQLESRLPFALRIDLSTGAARTEAVTDRSGSSHASLRDDGFFVRVYNPSLRCLVIGSSPIAVKLAEISACSGFETVFYEPDIETLPALPREVKVLTLFPNTRFNSDAWTAAILAFHDHERELPVFSELLKGPSFFLAAIGSQKAHEARKMALADAGFSDRDIERIKSPAGLVSGLKSAPLVALSILAQLVSEARNAQIIS